MASSEDELREELEDVEPPQNRTRRGTRIVEPDQGAGTDDEKDMVGELVEDEDPYVSAEEAAIHIEEAP
jgi:hypothetical protein